MENLEGRSKKTLLMAGLSAAIAWRACTKHGGEQGRRIIMSAPHRAVPLPRPRARSGLSPRTTRPQVLGEISMGN